MTHEIHWLVDNQVLLVKWTGVLSDAEIHEADEVIIQMLHENAGNQVHMLTDFTGLQSPPPLISFRNLKSPAEPNFGRVIIFGNISMLTRVILTFLNTTFRVKSHIFKTRDEAIRFLVSIDKTLPQIQTDR